MQSIIETIQTALLKELNKDKKFSEKAISDSFWDEFTNDLIGFQEDAKPVYAKIYSLDLENPEKIIAKIPQFYSLLIKEIAEQYVIDENFQAATYFLETKNPVFLKQVDFLKTLRNVITKVEREHVKSNLENGLDRLSFTISDTEMAQAIKRQERNALKKKFAQWDEELEKATPEIEQKQQPKVISLSWVKYAVAACVVLATGIFYFRNTNQDIAPTENTIVTSDTKKDSTQLQKNIPVKQAIVLAEIETISEKVVVQQSESMGFSGTEKPKITISYTDARQRIISLEKYIATPSPTKEPATLAKYKSELNDLKKPNDNHIFDGKTLTLFSKFNPKQDAVLVTDDQNYFLKTGSAYYHLKITKVPIPLDSVTNAATLEIVEKIAFENE